MIGKDRAAPVYIFRVEKTDERISHASSREKALATSTQLGEGNFGDTCLDEACRVGKIAKNPHPLLG